MKKVLFLLVFTIILIGCSKDDGNLEGQNENSEQEFVSEGSFALRATLENIKDVEQLGKSLQNDEQLCFQFEYPITLEYNNNTTISVASYSDLLDLLLNETTTTHIVAIAFPFEVNQENMISTISNEAEFQSLVSDCGYDMFSFDDVVAITDECFNVNYPISVFVNDESYTFNSESEAQSFFLSYDEEIDALGFDYPFSVTLVDDGTEVIIDDDYELVYLVEETCGIE